MNLFPSFNFVDIFLNRRKNIRIILICNVLDYEYISLLFPNNNQIIIFPVNVASIYNHSNIFFRFLRSKYYQQYRDYYCIVENERDLRLVLESLSIITNRICVRKDNYRLHKRNVFFLSSHIFYSLFHTSLKKQQTVENIFSRWRNFNI